MSTAGNSGSHRSPTFSNTKKAFKIAKKMWRCVQTKKGEVLTTPEIFKATRRNQRHSNQKKKNYQRNVIKV